METNVSKQIDNIRRAGDEFKRTAEGKALYLRLELARHVLRRMGEESWTAEVLAKKLGWPVMTVENIINGDFNWNTEAYGRLAKVLDLRLGLVGQ
jgi:ribosome-binding protein aMBF1 (putative translation factor)